MPNKETNRASGSEPKMAPTTASHNTTTKISTTSTKLSNAKVTTKELVMSPSVPAALPVPDSDRTELLGSLTTQQQQRTSARVIKKLRLEPPPADRDKREISDTCDTPIKVDEKDPLKFPTVKQRMPKALWSADEKSLFFEALNEYGKDFDAITAYICGKMKKKGMPDANLKTKTQVSHFYYRTWHKLSKHVHFDENVKKVVQELYALINYGELRKKLVCVNEKTCARLGEMVRAGSLAVRARGRNVRVRTPMCRALRRLNHIAERACGARVVSRAQVSLRARSAAGWARVQAAAHNPRAAAALPLRVSLRAFLHALQRRWAHKNNKHKLMENSTDEMVKESEDNQEGHTCTDDDDKEDLEEHLNLEPERIIVQEQKMSKKPTLHLGPRPDANIHFPVISPSEQLSSQKICFLSYLERVGSQRRDKDSNGGKIRAPKRQRKDSTTDKEKEVEAKKFKMEDGEGNKLMVIDETAIDGIELMANYKNNQDDEEKQSTDIFTEDEKEVKSEETAEEETERDKELSEKEKDSFSELEDDEKDNKSDSDNESDHGKGDKIEKKTKFKNLKVKFRIRPKKRGGSVYTLVTDKDTEDSKPEENVKVEEDTKPQIDVETAMKQIRKGWSIYDAGDLTIGDLYLMFGSRSRLELDYWWAEPTPPLPQSMPKTQKQSDSDKNFTNDKTLEKKEKGIERDDDVDKARESDTDIFSPKNTFSQDSNDGLSGDERKCEQLASPDHKSSSISCATLKLTSKLINRPQTPAEQNHQSGLSLLSDRLKRLLALAGNPHVPSNTSTTTSRCNCCRVCSQERKQKQQSTAQTAPPVLKPTVLDAAVFRHPTPIAPRPDTEPSRGVCLDGLPRWRRAGARAGRGRDERRVVVQRLLPLLPKRPEHDNLIPVKMVTNTQPSLPKKLPKILPKPPVKILPKPSPTSDSDSSLFYVMSESNGQFYFHDGERQIPITPERDEQDEKLNMEIIRLRNSNDDEDVQEEKVDIKDLPIDISPTEVQYPVAKSIKDAASLEGTSERKETQDIANFLPSESMSLSPSRLLRDSEGWLDGSVQDFSLSSFLGHLEGRAQPDLAVESQLQSLMAESSVDYVAKFADLAAEVTGEANRLPDDLS